VILSLLALAAQAAAAAPAAAEPYSLVACAELLPSSPQRAVEVANAWLAQPGIHTDARRCLGSAYETMHQYPAAATVYEQGARDAETAGEAGRAQFWIMAAYAWLGAGEAPRALRAAEAALAVPGPNPPDEGGARAARARVQVVLGHPDLARQDLDRALQLIPSEPYVWYLSAALARRVNDLARARADIARARAMLPDDPDYLLLAGTIAGLSGNMEEAERLYRRVVEVAPDSEAGREAAASLATVREVEVPAPAAANPPTPSPAPPRSS
jgi:tetratricopeptide (TPR) repeat protein